MQYNLLFKANCDNWPVRGLCIAHFNVNIAVKNE